ncbi:unnamed protein product [Durusdinium trenchii]|uniref:Nudix hydrolase domain-containing protein n=1 Tax=Durusdinium trenchii TaxID=1381693 RepID=A0ABP0QFL1_9DINO
MAAAAWRELRAELPLVRHYKDAPVVAGGASVRCLCSALSRPPEGRPWALTTSVDEISGSTVVTKSQSPNPLGPVGEVGGPFNGGLGEELFLVRGRQSGLWQLPGGMIEASDLNVWDAAAREFYEETGSQAPLPSSRLQGWFETTIELPSGGLFRGVIFVLQTEATCEVPFAVNGETREALWRPWRNLEDLDFRWPNDQTIPQIFDMAQAEDGRRPVVRAGCYMEMRPTLRCGGHMREWLS